MVRTTSIIQVGMIVRDVQGEELGTVTALWPSVDTATSDGPPQADQSPPDPEDVGCFQVEHGGILGVGVEHLYVPLQAVKQAVVGDGITLSCTRTECEKCYSQQPWFVHRDIV